MDGDDQAAVLQLANERRLPPLRVFVADNQHRPHRALEQRPPLNKAAPRDDNRCAQAIDLEPSEVQIAKTASKHVLGVMNQMAFEIEWAIDHAGGLWNVDVDDLNRHLRRSLHTKHGDYQRPLDLVHERLQSGP